MSPDAQDVLLKPIEDDKMVAILCTTEATKIRSTILSRCTRYSIRKVTREDILKRMQLVLTTEGVTFEDDAVMTVIDHSGGHVRDILNQLEMIAQLGPVTLDSVREYLNLGLVTTYYDILLSLGNVNESIRLVEMACDHAPAEDVCAGIAEAAMNSYRLANGLSADFTYTDRGKAKQVYERFQEKCLGQAAYFLDRRYATRISLLCDVIQIASGVPAPTERRVSAPVPTLAPQVPAPVSAQAPAPSPAPAQAPTPSLVVASPPVPAPALNGRSIGNLGSSDPCQLTSLDDRAVPKDAPRGAHKITPRAIFPDPNRELRDSDILSADEWRREFEKSVDQIQRTWGQKG
jgi:hypothetical protein